MDLISTVIAVVLFFVLSPSVLVRLPSKGNKYVVAGTHALGFGILFYFINSLVSFEGFVEGNAKAAAAEKAAKAAKAAAAEKANKENPCLKYSTQKAKDCPSQGWTDDKPRKEIQCKYDIKSKTCLRK